MITIERKKLERAIKAMLNSNSTSYEILNAADALNEALAQPEQEPVLEPACPVCSATPTFSLDVRVNEWSGQCKRCGVEGSPTTTEADAKRLWIVWHHKKLYTTPQQRPWVGLTEEEREEIENRPFSQNDWLWFYTRAIEAKLKEKNK